MGSKDPYDYWGDDGSTKAPRQWLGIVLVGAIGFLLACVLLFVLLRIPVTSRLLRPVFGLKPTTTPAVVLVDPTAVPTTAPGATPTTLSSETPTTMPTLVFGRPQIVYQISQTTEHTFDQNAPDAEAAALLTSFGVPLEEQTVPMGVSSPQTSWPLAGAVNDIQGAVYDDTTGQLFLVGTQNPTLPPLDPTDLLVALRAAYTGADDVGVSIDPINPDELGGPMQVNYYGNTENSHFGLVMFEADRHLKTLSSGEDNITGQPVVSTVPGYQSELAWMLDLSAGESDPRWHRMWYVVPDGTLDIKVSADNHAMMFDQVPIVVQARFVEFDANGEKHDVSGSDPAIDAFVQHLNQHFDEYGAEKKEVGQLKQLAKLLSIARWLRDQDARVDMDWLGDVPVDIVNTPATTPGNITSLSRSDSQAIYTVQLFGGVDFQFTNQATVPPPNDPVHFLGEMVHGGGAEQAGNAAELRAVARPLVPAEAPGILTLVQPVLRQPTGGQLPLEVTLTFDASSTELSSVGTGWTIEPSKVRLLGQPLLYAIEGQSVSMPNAVVWVDRASGWRTGYSNLKTRRDSQVEFRKTTGDGPDTLLYNYLNGQYELSDGGDSYLYDSNGALQTQQRGAEQIEYRRDPAGKLIAIAHSDGSQIDLAYDQGRLVRATSSSGQQADLSFGDAGLTGVDFPGGQMRIFGVEAPIIDVQTNDRSLQIELDRFGRVARRVTGPVERTFAYGENGEVIESVTGLPQASLTVERNSAGRITRVIATEEMLTADSNQAKAAIDPAMVEAGSILQQAFEGKALDLSQLVGSDFNQVALSPAGRWAMHSEGSALFVDGRLSSEQVQEAWLAARPRIGELAAQGYDNWALDPTTGTLVGRNATTGEVKAQIARATGNLREVVYTDFHFQPADLSRLATVLGAQDRDPNTVGIFQSAEETWGMVAPTGEVNSFPVGAQAGLSMLEGLVNNPDASEDAASLASDLGDMLAEPLSASYSLDWPAGMSADAQTAFLDIYPLARLLFKEDVPAEILQRFEEMKISRPKAEPIRTKYGWLLPGTGPYLIDAPPSAAIGMLLSSQLGVNDIRLVAPTSTPLRVNAYLHDQVRLQNSITGKEIVVLYTPHSDFSESQAQNDRAAFQPVRKRLEQLGVTVIDVGGDPAGHERLLGELASQNLVIFDIGHSDVDGTMQVYQDGSVSPDQFVTARGVKYFMTCCSVQKGIAAAAVRSGADTAVGTVQPVSPADVNVFLNAMASHLEQHPEGTLASNLDYLIRLQVLRDNGSPSPASNILPVSLESILPEV